MTTNTDGLPAPEARVRAYLDAQREEDARTGTTSDEIAWAVSDGNGLVSLAIGDIRDMAAELRSHREALDAVANIVRAGGSAWEQVAAIVGVTEGTAR